jgi:HD-GYP domain-containing protein (c-di-GMP phosphodiesterase class II)
VIAFEHKDALEELNSSIPLREKLVSVHKVLKERYDFIDRIAVAIYDPKSDVIRTFVDSSGTDQPLIHYETRLSDVPSLQEIIEKKRPRVVSDLTIYQHSPSDHATAIHKQGYRSSYTLPMYVNSSLFGFVFFNSYTVDPFDKDEILHHLDVFGHLISLQVINDISAIHTLLATVKTARDVTNKRDFETGSHIDRVAAYAQLIARDLADQYDLTDEYIEHIFLFAPLHDIGKIGIPDRILLKEGRLNEEEFRQMKTHTQQGREIIDQLLGNYGLESFHHVDVLKNIALYHHEAVDGSGYPKGLKGQDIPIESRIVAVADVFDALTSRRPYKEPWDNDTAFKALHQLSGTVLDRDCIDAMERHREVVEKIQQRYQEDSLG